LDIVLVGLTTSSYQQSQFFVASMASWIDFPGIFKLSSLAALVVESSNDDKESAPVIDQAVIWERRDITWHRILKSRTGMV
jgi:hypothetical protein